MEFHRKVRLACVDGMSARAAARYFNISLGAAEKALAFFFDSWLPPDPQLHRPRLSATDQTTDPIVSSAPIAGSTSEA